MASEGWPLHSVLTEHHEVLAVVSRRTLIVLSIIWIAGALKAGLFIRDAQDVVSRVDEQAIEAFSRDKKFVDIAGWRVAYVDRGSGEPIVLLHGCPFQSFEYSKGIPSLAHHYRVIAPDLLGLGDTIVRLDDDYRLPNQVRMVVGLLDWLGIGRAHFVGHDHGGAIVQLMMNSHIVAAIRLGFGGRLRVVPSVADLHVTAEVAPGVSLDVDQFVRRAEARGIVVNTLADFSAEASPRAGLVLGYGAIPTENVDEGLRRLARCFR